MNAMTLQDILAMQAARQRAYEADLDDMVRYGKGALFTSTVIVDLYKMFDQKGENLMGLRLEIPTEVTLGQLVQLLGEVTQEQFSDAFFLEQLQPYFSGIVADEDDCVGDSGQHTQQGDFLGVGDVCTHD